MKGTTGALLYPRLPHAVALEVIASHSTLNLEALRDQAALTHPEAEPAATGGHPADRAKLEEVQGLIRATAEEVGWPSKLNVAQAQEFDRMCGRRLFASMNIVPADAAEEAVWSFLTLVLVPEIGPWRFPAPPEERLIGRPRNVLRRTWWRSWALRPDINPPPAGCAPLGEDEAVQIMERSTLGGNSLTAQAMQAALWRAEEKGIPGARSEFMREFARRVLATKCYIQFDALDKRELCDLLDRICEQASGAMQS